jgi:hypothetical protein
VFFIGVFLAKEGRIGALVQRVVMFMENVLSNRREVELVVPCKRRKW